MLASSRTDVESKADPSCTATGAHRIRKSRLAAVSGTISTPQSPVTLPLNRGAFLFTKKQKTCCAYANRAVLSISRGEAKVPSQTEISTMNNKRNAVVIEEVDFRGSVSYCVSFDFFDEELNEVVKCKSAMLPKSQAEDMADSINNQVNVKLANDLF